MLRSLFILMMVVGTVPMIFIKPHVGILIWSWISYMNPHRISYGFISQLPMLDLVAGATIVSWLISREQKRFHLGTVGVAMLLFWGWTLVTTIFSKAPERSWYELGEFSKIMLFTLMVLPLINTKWRIHCLLYVIALSLGFYGLKGGAFTIVTGGNFTVLGPPGSFISDNNHLALALLMLIPILRYISLHGDTRWIKIGAFWAVFVVAVAVLGSQSRGALIAAVIITPFLVAKGRRRIAVILLLAVVGWVGYSFMPPAWQERMATISSYQEDQSASSRIGMWRGAYRVAQDHPIVGGGFSSNYSPAFISRYLEPGEKIRAYHSIYFMTLAEHGYVGLFLFLLLLTSSYYTFGHVAQLARGQPDMRWMEDLAKMLQVSLMAYATAGAFLSLAKFDFAYHICVMALVLQQMAEARAAGQPQPAPQTMQARLSYGTTKPAE